MHFLEEEEEKGELTQNRLIGKGISEEYYLCQSISNGCRWYKMDSFKTRYDIALSKYSYIHNYSQLSPRRRNGINCGKNLIYQEKIDREVISDYCTLKL